MDYAFSKLSERGGRRRRPSGPQLGASKCPPTAMTEPPSQARHWRDRACVGLESTRSATASSRSSTGESLSGYEEWQTRLFGRTAIQVRRKRVMASNSNFEVRVGAPGNVLEVRVADSGVAEALSGSASAFDGC